MTSNHEVCVEVPKFFSVKLYFVHQTPQCRALAGLFQMLHGGEGRREGRGGEEREGEGRGGERMGGEGRKG